MSETAFEHKAAAQWLLKPLVEAPPEIRLQVCRGRYKVGASLFVALLLPHGKKQVRLGDPIHFVEPHRLPLDMRDMEPDPKNPAAVIGAIFAAMDKTLPKLTAAEIVLPTQEELAEQFRTYGGETGPDVETMQQLGVTLGVDCQRPPHLLSTKSDSFPLSYLFPTTILQQCYDLYKPQKEPWTPGYKLI